MSDPLPGIDGLRDALSRPVMSTPALMRAVMLALLPGTALAAVLLGGGVLVNVLVAVTGCVLVEALVLRLRHRPVVTTLCDGSAALAGWLLALTVTPTLPAWQLLLGCAIAIGLAKHVFGGLGHNPFNPAMIAYAVLLISFPVSMTDWPAHAARPLVGVMSNGTGQQDWDGMTGQTPLDAWRQTRRQSAANPQSLATGPVRATQSAVDTVLEPAVASSAGPSAGLAATPAVSPRADPSAGSPLGRALDGQPRAAPPGQRQALIALAWLLGGLWLLWRRVIRWHIPVAMLGTLVVCELVAQVVGTTSIGPLATLFAGGAMLGAFFIATDPVSAAATPRGRLIYGCGIGLVTFTIRQAGSWPDGVAFGVLLMNGAVPLIDRLSVTRAR